MCHAVLELESGTVMGEYIEMGVAHETPIQVPIPQKLSKGFPFFTILISLIQIWLFYFRSDFWLNLGYDPHRRHEIFRFLTMMLVHQSPWHLWTNLILQIILGVPLEIVHRWKRVGTIYMCGVVGGTLFLSVFGTNKYGVGASAGVYALLLAHIAAIFLNCNWNEVDYKCYSVVSVLLYIALNLVLPLYRQLVYMESNVSHACHLGGAVTGFLISILVLRNFEKRPREKLLRIICAGILISLTFGIILVHISFPSRYFETEFNMKYKETFYKSIFKEIAGSPSASNIPFFKKCFENKDCAEVWANYNNETLNIS